MHTGFPLIRIGNAHDGGYLVPDDLDGIAAVFSPGVADTVDFEMHFASHGVPCFLADASVTAPPVVHERVHFIRKHLGPVPDERHVSLDGWVRTHAPAEGDLLLQMDIEGAEYDILRSTPADVLRRFRVIVIEFHGLHRIWRRDGARRMFPAFERILADFAVVHIHPNNCAALRTRRGLSLSPVTEFTFLRRDRAALLMPRTDLPHPLDRPNVPGRPDHRLDPTWGGTRASS
jgi:hypothetical protein